MWLRSCAVVQRSCSILCVAPPNVYRTVWAAQQMSWKSVIFWNCLLLLILRFVFSSFDFVYCRPRRHTFTIYYIYLLLPHCVCMRPMPFQLSIWYDDWFSVSKFASNKITIEIWLNVIKKLQSTIIFSSSSSPSCSFSCAFYLLNKTFFLSTNTSTHSLTIKTNQFQINHERPCNEIRS